MLGFGTHCHFSDFSGLILWFTLRDHPLRSIERKWILDSHRQDCNLSWFHQFTQAKQAML
jgi:hypothetical protein